MSLNSKVARGFLKGVFFVALLCGVLSAQEADQEDLSLVPTDITLVVHYIDKEMNVVDVSEVEDVLRHFESLPISLKSQNVSLPHGGGSILSIELKAFHNGEWVFLFFQWVDNSNDVTIIKPEQFRDAVAVLFPMEEVSADSLFSPRMGDVSKPVNIWHWKADWEEDLQATNSNSRIEARYAEVFHGDRQETFVELDRAGGGWGADNLLSDRARERSVEDLNAEKFGTLTSQEQQDVYGHAVWSRGRWSVVIFRKMATLDENDTQLFPGQKSWFSLAVWNGSAGDRNGQKSVSDRWHPLEIETNAK